MAAEKNGKKSIKSYIIAAIALTVMIGLCVWYENPFDETESKRIIIDICNAFTTPGVVFSGVSLLTFLASLGAYDSFAYAFSNFSLHNLWFAAKQPKKYKSLYEYKQKKDERGRWWWPEGLWLGLGSLTVSGILLIVYFIL